ncbi:MAG: spore germination protein [Clostridia bacterium]|nr:spore germination protein [Clostridia bacterium]
MEGSNSIKSSQVYLVIFVAQTGIGTIMLPSVLAKEVGHDGWISLLITGGLILLLNLLIVMLLRRYSDKAIYDINKLIFGKVAGTCFNALLVSYLFATTIGSASLFNYFIRITVLPSTPSWALAPFITLPSFYLVWQGLKPMSRFLFCSLLNYFIIIILIAFLFRHFRFSFLLPLGEAGIPRILSSIKTSFFAFIGFELIAFLYPYITNPQRVLKLYVSASITSMIFFILIVISCTAVFGENLLSILSMPFYNLSRIYNAPILERIDLYLIALWFIPMACSMRNYIFAAYDGLQKVFKLKKSRVTYTAFFIILLAISSIPKDFNQVLILIATINMLGIGVSLFLVLCFLLSFIRKKGVCTK